MDTDFLDNREHESIDYDYIDKQIIKLTNKGREDRAHVLDAFKDRFQVFKHIWEEMECLANETAIDNGFHESDPDTIEDDTIIRWLFLMISEIVEAGEGVRKGDLMDDHLPHRKMLEVELADMVIRCFDTARALKLDVAGAITEKMAYNMTREYKHGGKKF